MLEVEKIRAIICADISEGASFRPSDIGLRDYFITTEDAEEEETESVNVDEWEKHVETVPMVPSYPADTNVVAIDSTSLMLGVIPDGLVGAIRASIIIREAGRGEHSLEHYGPYLVPITNQNKDEMYGNLFRAVYGIEAESPAPDCAKTLDRVRNLFERHIQLKVALNHTNGLILLDGSLIGGTVANPAFFMRKIIEQANANGNSIVAISKSTGLTLQRSKRNILSLLDPMYGPCYVQGIEDHISQNRERYLGGIYVAKLTPLGEPFRIDIPKNTRIQHREIMNKVAGLAGDYGYPEELRLAHMTCVLSSIEVIELQSAAIGLHRLTMQEEIRPKLFPL